jgi:glycosyltransferase involved in cell wall biosynthesis
MTPITIIIPTINEPTLEQVVQAAKKELPDAEIIVVGFGASHDIAVRNSAVFLDMQEKTPKPIGINKAVPIAKNNWIIILDADAIPKSGWGDGMVAAFKQGRQIFSGSVCITEGNFWMKVYNLSTFHEFLSENRSSNRKYLPAINLGFTKNIFLNSGGWDEKLSRSQDYEWTLRLYKIGYTPWFDPKPCVRHIAYNQTNFSNVWNSWVRNGYFNWTVRNQYSTTLGTPKILGYPLLILLTAPIISLVPTLRIFHTSPKNFIKYFYLLPFIYLTKIAWCWGVYRSAIKDLK